VSGVVLSPDAGGAPCLVHLINLRRIVMRVMKRVKGVVAVVCVVLMAGCGQNSVSPSEPATLSGGETTGSQGPKGTPTGTGDAPTAPSEVPSSPEEPSSPMPPPGARCRTYATDFSTIYDEDDADASTTTCAFDVETRLFSCTLNGEYVFNSTVEKQYERVDDFVAEVDVLGRMGWTSSVDSKPSGEVNHVEAATYDGQGRLVVLATTRGGEEIAYWTETYSTWDTQGRPLDGVMTFEGRFGDCRDWWVSWTYRDDERQVVRTFSEGEGDGCFDETRTQTFDEDDNVIYSETLDISGWTTLEEVRITSSAEVCRSL